MARPRRVVCSTILNTSLAAMAAGDILNVDLLTGVEFASDQGFTVLKGFAKLTSTTAPTLGDVINVGSIVGRNLDLGHNVANQVSTNQRNLPWQNMNGFVFNGGWTVGGGNVIPFSFRGRRVVRGDNEAFILSITNASAATSYTFRLFSRVWIALP